MSFLTNTYPRTQPYGVNNEKDRYYQQGTWCKICEDAYPLGTIRCKKGHRVRSVARTPAQRKLRDETVVRY